MKISHNMTVADNDLTVSATFNTKLNLSSVTITGPSLILFPITSENKYIVICSRRLNN